MSKLQNMTNDEFEKWKVRPVNVVQIFTHQMSVPFTQWNMHLSIRKLRPYRNADENIARIKTAQIIRRLRKQLGAEFAKKMRSYVVDFIHMPSYDEESMKARIKKKCEGRNVFLNLVGLQAT